MSGLTAKPSLLVFVFLYFAILICMGIYFNSKVKTSDDFVLAGRSLGPIVLAGTLASTWIGSGTITGSFTVIAAKNGFIPSILTGIPLFLSCLLLMAIAPKVRATGCYTVAELIEARYGRFAKDLAAVIVILAFLGIVSYQYKGIAMVMNVTTGLDNTIGCWIGLVIIVFLALSGGLKTVAITDAASTFIIIAGVLLGIPIMISMAGGWPDVMAKTADMGMEMTLTGGLSWSYLIGISLPTMFLLIGNQNMFQRIAASKSVKDAKSGILMMMIALIIIVPAVVIMAFVSSAYFGGLEDTSMTFLATATVLPLFFGGLVLAASTALIVTTGNSYLLSCATNVTYDIYAKYINKKATDKQKLNMTRWVVLAFGLLAFLILQQFPTILSIQMYSYTIYGAGLTPAVLGAVLWKKATPAGGISSMLVGAGGTLIWELVLKKPGGFDAALVMIPAAAIVLIVISLLTYRETAAETEAGVQG